MSLTARITELVNCTDGIIELFECEEGEHNGESCWSIQLNPNTTTEITASRFVNNHHYSMVPRTVKVKRIEKDDFEAEIFSANDFVEQQTFFFRNKDQVGNNGPLDIKLVPASEGILAHLFRTK